MHIFSHPSVDDFILKLDGAAWAKVDRLVQRLGVYGKELFMPDAKPIGSGLWELRSRGHPAIRILYGFCEDHIILLVAFKKQANSIGFHQFKLAQKRLKMLCPK